MAKINIPVTYSPVMTAEGAPAFRITPEKELKRSVLACLLWENTFYESGQDIAERIAGLASRADPVFVADLAVKARQEYNLRHAPLWLTIALARRHALKADTLTKVIQRADELSEFMAMYWKDGKQPIAAQVKKGLAKAFQDFDAYQLSKYDRANRVRLRDVLFMVHAKPKDQEQAALWMKLVNGTLPSPDTWEVNLSAGADKKETWERLISEGRLGYLALLRNLRNMDKVGVDAALVGSALQKGAGRSRVLPFRFIAAARAVPRWESLIEPAMLSALEDAPKLSGKTVLLIDVSGSMDAALSAKSDLRRIDAACALAMLCREITGKVLICSFSDVLAIVPPRRGFALRDAIVGSQPHQGTYLGAAIESINQQAEYDRLIVFTDEQVHDRVPDPKAKGYIINVGTDKNGIGYGKWTHFDGFSEAIVRYIQESEAQ